MTSAAVVALLRIALYNGLTVKNYTVTTPLVSESHVFALVTDLHSTLYGEKQENLIAKISRYSPEAVFFAGDIADDQRGFYGTRVLIESLSKNYPCYYVAGNHERWVEYTDEIKGLISSCGATVVSDTSVNLGDNITLYGIDDPLFYPNEGFFGALSSLSPDKDKFNILLSHRPEYAPVYGEYGFNLTLCGHAHGGQVRIPLLLNGLYAPHQGWFPKYAGGDYSFDDGSHVIVSRGLMIDNLPRVFDPPELVIVNITPAK